MSSLIPQKPEQNNISATVIADASYCANTKSGGWAVWIAMQDFKINQSGTFKGRASNSTEAEYWAILNGIWLAYQSGAKLILAQTDCLSVVNKINQGTKELSQFQDATISARHVRGHTNRDGARYYVNRWCDHHARIHMRAQRNGSN